MSLKLLAADADDLKIIASALQDAILRVRDVRYDAVARAVSLRLTRYRHETDASERVECGVRIDGVLALKSQGIERGAADAYMVVLDMAFDAQDEVGGVLDVVLAGGGTLRMNVESLDVLLADVGEARQTRAKPDHESEGV
jgi:hypothetical protein